MGVRLNESQVGSSAGLVAFFVVELLGELLSGSAALSLGKARRALRRPLLDVLVGGLRGASS